MPKLWTETIEAHRREVHDAILDTTAALVAEHGLRSVTMSQIAEQVGIGRATLYKYFPDVGAILATWHERQLTGHLAQLTEAAARAEGPYQRLEAVLETYALIQHEFREAHRSELAAHLHQAGHDYSWLLYRAATLELWFRNCIEKWQPCPARVVAQPATPPLGWAA